MGSVVVVGSINVDIVMHVPGFPAPGVTLLADASSARPVARGRTRRWQSSGRCGDPPPGSGR